MKTRCLNKNHESYHNYGGRGILVCEEWKKSFKAFLDDMGVAPVGLSLGRIDNDKGYQPDNCRWETTSQQGSNRRDCPVPGEIAFNKLLAHNRRVLRIAVKKIAQDLGVSVQFIYDFERGSRVGRDFTQRYQNYLANQKEKEKWNNKQTKSPPRK